MSESRTPNHETHDPIRSHVRTLALDYAELLPPFVDFDEFCEAADTIEQSIEHAVRAEVESA